MMTREDAWKQLTAWTSSPSLLKHARTVELSMRQAALRYGNGDADVEMYAAAGLLHDADYERWPDEHPAVIVRWLQERGEQQLADAVAGHYSKWGKPCDTPLSRSLLACDETTGFVVACALLRPDGIESLTPQSVKKKMKDRSFASKVDRDEIHLGCGLLGVELDQHLQMIIDALKPYARELGLDAESRLRRA